MLSVADARHLLGADCPMTDEEIKAMLDQFRQVAFITLDTAEEDHRRATADREVSES